jgi:hypothetical protein
MGEANERKSMMMPLLTASSPDYLLGASAVNRVISAADQPPEVFECELDAESIGETQGGALELGSIVSIQSSENQNKAGIGEAILYQCLKIQGDPFEAYRVKFKRYQALAPEDFAYVIPAGVYINYVLTDNFNPPASGEYVVYISPGAIFGSYNTAIAGFRTGSPSAGVTFKFIARWQILGMGGVGGDAGLSGSITAQAGGVGGTAFEANCNCTIDNGAGLIWAGGGGASGQFYVSPQGPGPFYVPASGGGGGQGFGEAIGGRNADGAGNFSQRAQSGNQSAPGTSGCPPGGNWGESGLTVGAAGGAAGVAIKSNGFSVTIISGDNPLSIRGRKT